MDVGNGGVLQRPASDYDELNKASLGCYSALSSTRHVHLSRHPRQGHVVLVLGRDTPRDRFAVQSSHEGDYSSRYLKYVFRV